MMTYQDRSALFRLDTLDGCRDKDKNAARVHVRDRTFPQNHWNKFSAQHEEPPIEAHP